MEIITYQDYRSTLTEIELKNSPENLYFEGDFSMIHENQRISVVGSRNVSAKGIKRAEIITKKLVEKGVTVVSGLAKGVDTVAHTTAIEAGGKTIAVLGNSIDKVYPKENESLLGEIKKGHLVISQFPKGYPSRPSNFPIRNRTMALISDATIIIEASEKSGTRHQGWEALRLGRSVLILENLVKEKELSWTKEMLNYGAQILNRDNFDYLIDELPLLTQKVDYAF